MKRILLYALALAAVAVCVVTHSRISAARKTQAKIQKRADFYARFGMEKDGRREFASLPSFVPHSAGRAALGAKLYLDPRIASGVKRTCVACHVPDFGGVDNKLHAKTLTRPAMNAVFADVFLHDASVTGLPALVERMMSDPKFGACPPAEAVRRIASDLRMQTLFGANYPDGLVASNLVDAICQHCRTLFTPPGAFDFFCGGNTNALSPSARAGFNSFRRRGCASCHSGPALGTLIVDGGVKVPALRGLSLRRRYFSSGMISDLGAALSAMPNGDAESAERADLLAFLNSL